MSKTKHTPGPWAWYQGGNHRALVQPGVDGRVLMVRSSDGYPSDANAALIAAAPALLRHLALILEVGERNDYETYRAAVREIARAALAKAEGGR